MRFQSPIVHALILLAVALPYFVNLGTSSIWDASEAFYAETPREMLASGDYIAPHFNFEPRAQKPPLTYWIVAISYMVFGINEFALRLPGALAGLGVILFCYGTARRLFSPRAALMAALMTATTARVFILARRLPIDIFLLFFLMAILYFLVRAIQTNRKVFWILAYLFAGLGFLTKGPVAIILPAGACLLWILLARQIRLATVRFPAGIAAFLAVVLPWYILIYRRHGWTYIAPFFLGDNLSRFASGNFGPARGLFYYFGVGVSDFFPWSILVPCAIVFLFRWRKAALPIKSLQYGLPILWCVFTFLLFSLSKNKQEYYIAPVYPVAAVILAGVLDSFFQGLPNTGAKARAALASWLSWAFGFQAFVFLAFSLSSFYIFHLFLPELPSSVHNIAFVILLAVSALFVWSVFRRNLGRCFCVLTAILWIMYVMCVTIYLPALEQYRPVKKLCRLIEAELDADTEAGYFRTALPSMAFYLKRQIFEESSIAEMRRRFRSGKRVFCILSRKAYDTFDEGNEPGIYVLAVCPRFAVRVDELLSARSSKEEELLLISNRPSSKIKTAGERATS